MLQDVDSKARTLLDRYEKDGETVRTLFRGTKGRKASAIIVDAQRLLLWVVWFALNPSDGFEPWKQFNSMEDEPVVYDVVQAVLAYMSSLVPEGGTLPNLPQGQSSVQMSACLLFYVLLFSWAPQVRAHRFASLIHHAAVRAQAHGASPFTTWAGIGKTVRIPMTRCRSLKSV